MVLRDRVCVIIHSIRLILSSFRCDSLLETYKTGPEMHVTLQMTLMPRMTSELERRIHDQVMSALRSSGYVQHRDLEIQVVGHNVHLTGRLSNYYLKQQAHYAVLNVPGVAAVFDDVDVVS